MLKLELLGTMLLVSACSALYGESPDVVTLTADSFAQLVTNSSDVWVVMFYAPWCGASKQAVPKYSKAACALKGLTKGAKLGAMDAEKYYDATFPYVYDSSTGYLSYPSIEIFTGSQHVPYESSRSAENYIEEVLDAAKKQAIHRLRREDCKLLGDSSSSSEESENIETTTEELVQSTTEIETDKETTTEVNIPTTTEEVTTEIATDRNAQDERSTAATENVETTTEELVQSKTENNAESTTQNLLLRFPHLAQLQRQIDAALRKKEIEYKKKENLWRELNSFNAPIIKIENVYS